MNDRDKETVTFRDMAIIFKNFNGDEREFNKPGDRNFSIMLGEADANGLLQNGWNVKPLKRQEEDEEQLFHLKVAVSYKIRPPRVWLVTAQGTRRTMLGESLVGMLDKLEAIKVDLEISPYDWQLKNGQSGRKAYLRTLFFHMYESALELEYANVEELPAYGDVAVQPELPSAEVSTNYDYEGTVV